MNKIPSQKKITYIRKNDKPVFSVIIVYIVLIGVIIFAYVDHKEKLKNVGLDTSSIAFLKPKPADAISKKKIEFISKYEIRSEYMCECSFEVQSNARENTVVVLQDINTNEIPAVVYVRAGDTVGLRVPPGVYSTKLITGQEWVNDVDLFGVHTSFKQGLNPLVFSMTENGCIGRILILRKTIDGNFKTETTGKVSLY